MANANANSLVLDANPNLIAVLLLLVLPFTDCAT